MKLDVVNVATQAYPDQKPGTSGLRKKVKVFEKTDYAENFIQAILDATSKPKFLVVGGDGRYYSGEVIKKIINLCAANGVQRLVIPRGGILSTPAASALIRSLKADGGIVLTASHNPGGPEGDFGIKYNISNGGPAPESVTDQIYDMSKTLTSYKSLFKRPNIDINAEELKCHEIGHMTVELVDPVDNYLQLMRQVFDFDKIKTLFTSKQGDKQFQMVADSMNGVVGPYAKRILIEELGVPVHSVINSRPLPDFGGLHPDPNLTYAKGLVARLENDLDIDFGVAFDGDGDRNMILGREAFFVTPGDSLAVIASNIRLIKWFASDGPKGYARSFPTAPAIDRVAKVQGVQCYQTPTGWKFFGNLMDANLLSLCGEESFGTGSDHIREKDGLWACLAWLSIMAQTGKTVKELVLEHWDQFGRDYFCRYDFEDCDQAKCETMFKELEAQLCGPGKPLVGKKFGSLDQYIVQETGNFEYVDPVDKSVTSRQGLYVKFRNGARVVFRMSGTGSSGQTVRLYVNDYSMDHVIEDSRVFLKELLDIACSISKISEHTGRTAPTVIT